MSEIESYLLDRVTDVRPLLFPVHRRCYADDNMDIPVSEWVGRVGVFVCMSLFMFVVRVAW